MKLLLLAFAGCLAPAFLRAQETGSIQPSTPEIKTALTQVVTRQLAAFRAGDFPTAYTFAAAEIKQQFPAAIFEKMVRANYAIMLLHPKVDFGVVLDDGQNGVVFVELTNAPDVQVFRYLLKREAAVWKISGVEQVEKAGSGNPPLSA